MQNWNAATCEREIAAVEAMKNRTLQKFKSTLMSLEENNAIMEQRDTLLSQLKDAEAEKQALVAEKTANEAALKSELDGLKQARKKLNELNREKEHRERQVGRMNQLLGRQKDACSELSDLQCARQPGTPSHESALRFKLQVHPSEAGHFDLLLQCVINETQDVTITFKRTKHNVYQYVNCDVKLPESVQQTLQELFNKQQFSLLDFIIDARELISGKAATGKTGF